VRDLVNDSAVATSLVGTIGTQIVGHAIFTQCNVVGDSANATLLGPLAVAPAWHRQGIGSAIVRAGFRKLESAGVGRVYVLGDPAYYRRVCFQPE
jgi:putative acetyltransferase